MTSGVLDIQRLLSLNSYFNVRYLNYVTLVDNTISLGDREKPLFYGRLIHKP